MRSCFVSIAMAALLAIPAEARITRIQIAKTEPAFGGISFGTVGPYERLTGKAFGEVDPKAPGNALIQDIQLAPTNARGMVEYVTDIDIVRPVNLSKSNGILFFNIVNRGNKGGLQLFNANVPGQVADINNLVNAGDGFMERKGYTMIWFGWQADILPGGGRMTMSVPVARNPDGSAITGIVRSELVPNTSTDTLSLSSGWFNASSTPYPTVSTDNRNALADGFLPTLTVRRRQQGQRTSIANVEWSFATCGQNGAPATPSATHTASIGNRCLKYKGRTYLPVNERAYEMAIRSTLRAKKTAVRLDKTLPFTIWVPTLSGLWAEFGINEAGRNQLKGLTLQEAEALSGTEALLWAESENRSRIDRLTTKKRSKKGAQKIRESVVLLERSNKTQARIIETAQMKEQLGTNMPQPSPVEESSVLRSDSNWEAIEESERRKKLDAIRQHRSNRG